MEKLSKLQVNLGRLYPLPQDEVRQAQEVEDAACQWSEEELPPVDYPAATPGEDCFKDLVDSKLQTPGQEVY